MISYFSFNRKQTETVFTKTLIMNLRGRLGAGENNLDQQKILKRH
jgi:hypothetical protein